MDSVGFGTKTAYDSDYETKVQSFCFFILLKFSILFIFV